MHSVFLYTDFLLFRYLSSDGFNKAHLIIEKKEKEKK